jgi:hypothetical protein
MCEFEYYLVGLFEQHSGNQTSRRRVSALLTQYFSAMKGLNSKWAFSEISLMLIGFETGRVDPAMTALL